MRGVFVQPPLQVYGTAGRYASACWSAAAKEKKLEKIEQELDDVGFALAICGVR